MSVGKKEKINVLSLFDGMSCGQIALKKLGVEIENYYASEIDKHAIKVTQHNYPDTIQLGDITKVKAKLLCLSEVYSYICNYDSNLQSNIREWEVLYWLDKNFTFSAKIGTQEPNEGQKVSKSSSIQRIEEVWFSNREMGSVRKFGDDTRSGSNGKEKFYLNPNHCEKLQTVPLDYTKIATERQRFRMLGNGWTVDVIAYIFSFFRRIGIF